MRSNCFPWNGSPVILHVALCGSENKCLNNTERNQKLARFFPNTNPSSCWLGSDLRVRHNSDHQNLSQKVRVICDSRCTLGSAYSFPRVLQRGQQTCDWLLSQIRVGICDNDPKPHHLLRYNCNSFEKRFRSIHEEKWDTR